MANIKEIAKYAGVSVSTVPRVLNQLPYVSDLKRAAVQRVIDELDYSSLLSFEYLGCDYTIYKIWTIVACEFSDHPEIGCAYMDRYESYVDDRVRAAQQLLHLDPGKDRDSISNYCTAYYITKKHKMVIRG